MREHEFMKTGCLPSGVVAVQASTTSKAGFEIDLDEMREHALGYARSHRIALRED